MNLHDIFKSFFGIRNPGNHGEFGVYRNDCDDEDNDENDPQDEDNFFLDAGIPHPSDMFRHFEEMFRSFGLQDFPPPQFGTNVPGLEALPHERNDSLRNKMLKDPEFSPSLEQPQYKVPTQDKTDRDLDELNPDELGKVLVSPDITESFRQPSNYRSFFKSISVSTVRGPDGKIEQKKIVRDSSGNEETTITRSHGDQTYSLTTKRDPTGCEEKHEDLINLDEGKVGEFEKKWTRQSITSDPIKDIILADVPPMDQNMFKSFFQSWFPK